MSSPHLNYHVAFRDSDCPRHSSSTTSRLLNSELARKMMRDHVDGRDKNNNNSNNNKNVTHNNSGSHEDEHDDCTDLLLQYCHPRGPLGRDKDKDKDKDKDREDDRQPLLSPATSSDAVSSSSSPDPTPFYPSFLGSASSMLLSPLSSLLSGTAATAADADDAGDGNGDNSNNNNNNNNNNDNNMRSTLMEPSSSMPPPLQLAPPSSLPSTPRSKSTHSHSAPHPIHAKMQSFPSSRESQPQRPQTSESYQTQLRQEAHHEMERQQQLKERKNPKLSLPDPKHVAALPTPSVTTSTIAVASAAAMTPANNYNHNNHNHNNSNNRNENNPLPSHDCNYHHLQENAYEDFGIERKLVARQPDQDRDGVPIATPPSSHKKMGIMARDIRLGKRNKNAHKKEKGAAAPFGGGGGKGWWGAGAKKQSRQQPSQQPQERQEDGPDDRPRTPQMEHQQQQQQHKQYQEDKLQFPRPRTLSSPGVLLRSSHNNSGRSGNSGDGNNVSIHNTDNHGNDSPTNHHPHPWISMAGFHLKKTKSTPSKTLKSFRKSNNNNNDNNNNNNNDNECIDANNKTSPSRTSTTPHRKSYQNASPRTRNPPLKKNRAEGDTTLRLRSDRRRHSHHQDKCHQTSRNPNPNTTITTTRETGQLPNASVPVDIDEISIGSSNSERDGGYTYYSAPTEGLLLRHCCYDDDPYGMSPAVPSTAADVIVNVNANDTIATGNRTHDTLQGNRTKAHTHPSTHATGGPTRNHHLDTERVLSQLGMEVGEEDYCIEGEFGSRERMAKLQYHQHRLDSKRGHPRHHPHHRHGERNRHGATAANNNGQQNQQDDVRKNSNSNNNKNENQRSDKGVVPVQTMKKLARQTLESIRNRTHSEESGGGEAEAMQQHGIGIDKNKTYAVPSPTFKNASNHTKSNQEGNTTPKLIFGSKVLALLRRHRNKHNSSNSNSNNYTLDKVPHQIITIVSSEDEEGNEIAITPEEMLLVQRWQMARARREGKSGYYGGYDDSIALGDGDYKGPVDVDEDDYDDDDRDANIETSLEVGVGFPSPSPGDASFQSDHATYDSMYHVKSNEDVLSTTASSCDQTAIMDNRRRRRPKF